MARWASVVPNWTPVAVADTTAMTDAGHVTIQGGSATQRGEMRDGETPVMILNEMQVFDQQIAPARAIGQQRLHIGKRVRIDLTALRRARRLAAAIAFAVGARRRLNVHERLLSHDLEPFQSSNKPVLGMA